MVFVTGATGLVGSFVCRELLKQGSAITALYREESDFALVADIKDKIEWVKGDILDMSVLEKVVAKAEKVIHAAAVISFHKRDLGLMLKTNVEGTSNLINVCLRDNVSQFVYVSSVAALGRTKASKRINENNKWEYSSYNSGYALSKYLAELEVWRGREEGLKVAVVNPSIVLGPGDWDKGSTTLFKYVYDKKSFYPTGSINYIDVRDLVSIILKLMNGNIDGERYIVNAGQMKYKEVFEKIATRFETRAPSKSIEGIWLTLAVILSRIKAVVTGKRPELTSESAKVAGLSIFYENKKVIETFDFKFKALDESLDWTCKLLMDRQASTN